MFSPSVYENTRPGGFGVLEIADPTDGEEQSRRFVPLKRTVLTGDVAGPLVSMRLTQVSGYAAEQCGETLEALYRFPLPGDAAVTQVRVSFGSVEIFAELRERVKAEAEYKATKDERSRAGGHHHRARRGAGRLTGAGGRGALVDRGRGGAQAAGREVIAGEDGASTIDLGDLPAGRPTWVTGRVPMRDAEIPESLDTLPDRCRRPGVGQHLDRGRRRSPGDQGAFWQPPGAGAGVPDVGRL